MSVVQYVEVGGCITRDVCLGESFLSSCVSLYMIVLSASDRPMLHFLLPFSMGIKGKRVLQGDAQYMISCSLFLLLLYR